MIELAETDPLQAQAVKDAFEGLSKLEKEFANVELDALRRREHSLAPLYARRTTLLRSIPSFWPTVLPHGPEDFTAVLQPLDARLFDTITSITVERYQITSATSGEPRSLRFTFEFAANEWFEDRVVVKEFEYVTRMRGQGEDAEEVGGFVSVPVGFKWTKAGKKLGLGDMLDGAVELYKAEQALVKEGKGGKGVKVEEAERKGLWQYEKLREAIEKVEVGDEEEVQERGSFLEWFGFRGMVNDPKEAKDVMMVQEDGEGDDDEDMDGDDDGMLDVEIFPAGEEVALALGEELWENVMDVFMQAQMADDLEMDSDDDEDEDDEDIPDLVDAEEFGGFEDDRPTKKQKKN